MTVGLLSVMCLGAKPNTPVKVVADTLVYDDTDAVTVVTTQVGARAPLDDGGGQIAGRVVVDVVSAASVDVVSQATGTFTEQRYEAGLDVSKSIGGVLPSLGYRYSHEPDYRSHGVNAGLQTRLGSPDTVLSASYGLTLDTIGRVETPLDTWSHPLTTHQGQLAIAQVFGPRTLVRLVYSLTTQEGYMEKPYRHIALFNAAGLQAARTSGGGLTLDNFDQYRLDAKPDESVPDERLRHATAVRAMRYVAAINGSVRLDYQFYIDSWDIAAHMVEPTVYVDLDQTWRVAVHGRFYKQTAARFWQRTYDVSDAGVIPSLRTADKSLSPFWTLSGGGRVEWRRGNVESYVAVAAMWTEFQDSFLIGTRVALTTQMGLRWSL